MYDDAWSDRVRRMQVVNTDLENEIQWHSGIEFNISYIRYVKRS